MSEHFKVISDHLKNLIALSNGKDLEVMKIRPMLHPIILSMENFNFLMLFTQYHLN